MTSKELSDGSITRYTYEASGQLATVTDATGLTRYEYDSYRRLSRRTEPDVRSIQYSYNTLDHRVCLRRRRQPHPADHRGRDHTLDFDVNDSLVAASGFGAAAYTYDAAGRLTRVDAGLGQSSVYSWTAENRLVAASVTTLSGTTDVSYRYDAAGLMVGCTKNGTETRYLLDTQRAYAEVATESASDGTLLASSTYGLDRISRSASTTSFCQDLMCLAEAGTPPQNHFT